MTFKQFSKEHIEEARKLALNNYEEERLAVPELPAVDSIPMVELFAEMDLELWRLKMTRWWGFSAVLNLGVMPLIFLVIRELSVRLWDTVL